VKRRFSVWTLLAFFSLSMFTLPIRSAEAQTTNPNTNRLVVPISGTVNGVAGTLTGSLAISRFARQNGQLVAIGALTATVTDASGAIVNTIVRQVAVPVAQATGSCSVLHLELGPLDLDLLGLVIHLDRVVLDITAETGPGNLLGNLLCAIAGLLDTNSIGTQLVNLLNQLLAVLGGL
jgi:hypothetical protein